MEKQNLFGIIEVINTNWHDNKEPHCTRLNAQYRQRPYNDRYEEKL